MSVAFQPGAAGGIGTGSFGVREKDYRADFGKNAPASAPTRALLDDYRAKFAGGKEAKVLPVHVSFPAFGTSIFLVSELTAENQSPAIELSYQRDKKDGGK
jgi:hypothetical protein